MGSTPTVKPLIVQPLSSEAFQPFGQVSWAIVDGKPYDADDAQLVLDQGIPRFYVMRLHHRGDRIHHITHHQRCTQCLGSLMGQPWLIAVAPPSAVGSTSIAPALEDIVAFRIPGDCFIKLHVGTWHAGPYFTQETMDFYNLELSDTNLTDHHTCDLVATYGVELAFQLAPESP